MVLELLGGVDVLAGAGVLAAGVLSVLAGASFLSDFSAPLSVFAGSLEEDAEVSDVVLDLPRESVTYQPLPLKTMPTGWNTLRRSPPHVSQVVRGASEKLWRRSMVAPQLVQV